MNEFSVQQIIDFKGIAFEWPWLLWALLLVPILGWYMWKTRQSVSTPLEQYPGLQLRENVASPWIDRFFAKPIWHRLVLLVFLLGLLMLCIALARPQALLAMPHRQIDLMLVIDTSASMKANDTEPGQPNRLKAAQALARQFVDKLPSYARVGLVSVAASAQLAQSPTKDREALRQAIDRLDAQRGTAIGSGIVIALSTLRPDADLDVEKLTTGRSSRGWYRDPSKANKQPLEPVEPGSNRSMAIIVISDGKPTIGIDPKEAAKFAMDLGIRIYSVGVGTTQGGTVKLDGVTMRTKLEEEVLQDLAQKTLGEYFQAASTSQLQAILKRLNARLILQQPRQTEITALFVAIGSLALLFACFVSLIRRQRIV